jgi:hypothetical protein
MECYEATFTFNFNHPFLLYPFSINYAVSLNSVKVSMNIEMEIGVIFFCVVKGPAADATKAPQP